jgi:hypothetical protein
VRVLEHLLDDVLHRTQLLFDLLGSHLGFGGVHTALHAANFALNVSLHVIKPAFGLLDISVGWNSF